MQLTIVSYNGHALSGSYEPFFAHETPIMPPVDTDFVPRAGAWPVYAGKTFPAPTLTIGVVVSGTTNLKVEELNNWFSVEDETMHQLIVSNANDGAQYYVNATCKQPGFMDGQNVYFVLSLENPIWQAVTQDSTSWSVTASGDTDTITILGNDEAYPVLEITPTAFPAGTWPYVQYVQEYPQSAYAWPRRWLDVSGATAAAPWGMDTAALITGGKMQASSDPGGAGGDIRVLLDGRRVDYWIGGAGINTTDTRIFIVADQPVKREMTLLTAIASSDTITTVDVALTAANLAAMKLTRATGRFIIDSEEFTYTSRTILTKTYRFNGVSQAERNTTQASHSVGATIRILPYDVQILYGNMTCAAQVMDDTYKPVLNMTTSRNDSPVYATFASNDQKRAGSWKPTIYNPGTYKKSVTYTGDSNGGDVDPATAMGMSALAANVGGVWKPSSPSLAWVGAFPDAWSAIITTGQKYIKNATTTWPSIAMLQSSGDGITWVNEINETAPASTDAGGFVATTNTASESVPNTSRFARFLFSGTVNGAANNEADWEIAGATVTLVNPPLVTRRAELNIAHLDFTLTNTTTGDAFDVFLPLIKDKTLYIDTDPDAPFATWRGQDVSGALTFNSIRAKWLALTPNGGGINILTITGTIGAMTIIIKHRARFLYL